MQMLGEQLVTAAKKLSAIGLNQGTSGNISVRSGDGFLITPSGVKTEDMTPHEMVFMNFSGWVQDNNAVEPSSEWRFHRDILQTRAEVHAVVHTHSMFATTMACLRRDIPPFHYMIALAGGDSIRCASYALFGSQTLSYAVLQALVNRKACLLANHGMIAIGKSLEQAVDIAVEVEALCEQYWRALQIGEPHLLTAQEMAEVFQQFKGYGSWDSA
jgi:L-fuculose-phosphate aldolase